MEAACTAFVTLATDSARVSRALLQYELALREWYLGGEWLALNHLRTAAENLTNAVIRKMVAARGVSEEDLAHEYGLVTDDPEQPRWKDLLGARVTLDGRTWTMHSGAWSQAGPADGALPRHQARRVA